MYLKYDMKKGDKILEQDIYYAMPLQEGCLNASHIDEVSGKILSTNINKNQPVKLEYVKDIQRENLINNIKQDIIPMLSCPIVTGKRLNIPLEEA